MKGLPAVRSRDDLQKVATGLICRITVHECSCLKPSADPAQALVANFPRCLQRDTIPACDATMSTAELLGFMPKTGTIGETMTLYFIFLFSSPRVPILPKEGVKANLFFPGGPDDLRNRALIARREKLIGIINEHEPDDPQIHQWPRNIET